ncbi:MAG: electron transfer flavoprotein subunit beta/FixA family protein [Nitrospirota bacterium]|nr:electron transfer flavoprotein subunit beta/FixA family protein [Nitrospirota bacterium]
MNIVVCIKQVPDTAARLRIDTSGAKLDIADLQWVMNPYDEYAVEEALQLKEKHGGTVTVITVGPERSNEALRSALAMGVDEAVRVWADSCTGLDVSATARILADALKTLSFDVLLFGRQAVDDGAAAVGAMIGELLDLPCVATVQKLEIDDHGVAVAQQEIEGGSRKIQVKLPAIFTAQKGLNTPRYASLPGIMKAKKKEIAVVAASTHESHVSTTVLRTPPERTAGEVLTGDVDTVVSAAVQRLREKGLV